MKITEREQYFIISSIFIGIGAFLLGGLTIYHVHKGDVNMKQIMLSEISAKSEISKEDARVYASSRGSRYYPWWCDGGAKIAKNNIVWYETKERAERDGYTIAKSCEK